MRYVEKAHQVVEAVQWLSDNPASLGQFSAMFPDMIAPHEGRLLIMTPNGQRRLLNNGDWIIRYNYGFLDVCPNDLLPVRFMPVTETEEDSLMNYTPITNRVMP